VKKFGLPRSKYVYGTLSNHDLEEALSYECFSYVWGTVQAGSMLGLDSYMIPISHDHDMALRCLVHKTEPRARFGSTLYA
jgi:hypothetical protein